MKYILIVISFCLSSCVVQEKPYSIKDEINNSNDEETIELALQIADLIANRRKEKN